MIKSTSKKRGGKMMLGRVCVYCLAGLLLGNAELCAGENWEVLEPYFSAPKKYAGDVGEYSSPLVFDSGRRVEDPEEWPDRRAEILKTWHGLMGEWPPVVENPVVEILKSERRENFVQHTVRFGWTPNEETNAYLLIPDGKGKRPGVVTVYYEPETSIGLGKEERDFGLQLARRGFVVFSIGTTVNSNAKTFGLYWPSLEAAKVEPLSMLGYAAANAYHVLANRAEVDRERIGITGHSFGGKWSMFGACLYEKYACAVVSDPGIVFDTRPSVNYWEPWYLGYHPKPWRKRGVITEENPGRGVYLKMLEEGRDLHELHALMAPRPFFVSGGSEDQVHRWQPLNRLVEVNTMLGAENRVGMSNRPDHGPTPESNDLIYRFFEHFLMGK